MHLAPDHVRRRNTSEEIDVSGAGQCWGHASCLPQGAVRVVSECVGVASWIKPDFQLELCELPCTVIRLSKLWFMNIVPSIVTIDNGGYIINGVIKSVKVNYFNRSIRV